MIKKSFKDILNCEFNFLKVDYGFELVSCKDNPDFYKLIFKNVTTGVSITYDYRDANIFVYLIKLVNGQIVEDKIPISINKPLNSIELSYIIKYRNEESLTKPLFDDSVNSFEDLVKKIATNLKNYADDVLKGNFNIFSEVDSLAKKRRLEWQNSK